jgi:hypothetical protein
MAGGQKNLIDFIIDLANDSLGAQPGQLVQDFIIEMDSNKTTAQSLREWFELEGYKDISLAECEQIIGINNINKENLRILKRNNWKLPALKKGQGY